MAPANDGKGKPPGWPGGIRLGVLPLIYLDGHNLLCRETEDSNLGPP
jgi:hypothetical protein